MRPFGNYQKMLDSRLSKPKSIKKVQSGYLEKFYNNSVYDEQKEHQSAFKSFNSR